MNVDDIFMNFESRGPLEMTAPKAKQIFYEQIVPQICAEGRSPKHPTFIMVAGQPGSGKSTAIRQAELGLWGATQIVIGDDFDAFVPNYHALASKMPMDAAGYARSAGSGYFGQATIARAERKRQNLVIEHAVAEGSVLSAERYRWFGYRTELHIVATPHYQSWTGVLDRAEKALSKGHIGTNVLVARDAYDDCYAGWARAVFDAEQQKQYDRVVITRRDGTVMYDNQLVRQRDGTVNWAMQPKGLEVLLLERHRPVTKIDAHQANQTWDRIVKSPHMHACLGRPLLKSYADEITGFVNSQASRVDLNAKGPARFGEEALKEWSKNVSADLYLTVSSRDQFGPSPEFDNCAKKYYDKLSAAASQYHGDSLAIERAKNAARTRPLDAAGKTGVSLPGAKYSLNHVNTASANTSAVETSQKRPPRLTRLQDVVRSGRLQEIVKRTFRSGASYDERQGDRESSGRGS
ncbi:MAG: hypothetical protein EOR16_30935 [Mesorhizobium sp.]|uniref:zeta toxin family protein n=1 Tax=Mesorhizobium sp. TaxID=1871066 RepID=UPI000FE59214|nr:zeta toxin family protein [Mesorhizobium sp.]RWI50075.1 MAG: hypothetical protein EOR16_30935 [Mesorhizobium sp.]